MRADIRVYELGLADSREKARALIMSGFVYADGKRLLKPGANVSPDTRVEVVDGSLPYVSRGGLKLKKAVDEFALNLKGVIAADIGASTGGFTDCMLIEGAKKVYSIDVGYGQFDWRLRNDERVSLMERTNARFVEPEWFNEPLTFAAMDVAFISVRLILPRLYACMEQGRQVVALIKPQFEAGREERKRRGVIRDKAVHERVCVEVLNSVLTMGYRLMGFTYSPITGPKGNIEFLALLEVIPLDAKLRLPDVDAIVRLAVEEAHEKLRR